MKRRQLLKTALIASPALLLSNPGRAHYASKVTWTMTTAFPEKLDILFNCSRFICETVSRLTDHRFEIQLFKAGQITPTAQALDAVSQNIVEMSHTCGHYYTAQNPAFALMSSVPFGLNSRQFNAWLAFGKGLERLNQFHEKYNLIALAAGSMGAVMGGWYKKEVKSIEDFKGLKIHASGLSYEIMNRIGAAAQKPDIENALSQFEQLSMDAAESMGPYNDEKIGYSQAAPYYYYPGWNSGNLNTALYINKEKWDSLAEPYKQALTTACELAQSRMLAQFDSLNPQTMDRLIAAGARFLQFPPEVIQAFHLAAQNYYADISVRHEAFRDIFSPMLTFRKEAYLWHQIADFAYDQFMLRHIINQK